MEEYLKPAGQRTLPKCFSAATQIFLPTAKQQPLESQYSLHDFLWKCSVDISKLCISSASNAAESWKELKVLWGNNLKITTLFSLQTFLLLFPVYFFPQIVYNIGKLMPTLFLLPSTTFFWEIFRVFGFSPLMKTFLRVVMYTGAAIGCLAKFLYAYQENHVQFCHLWRTDDKIQKHVFAINSSG